MLVTVSGSGIQDRHRLLITVREEDHDDVAFYKNMKELLDFIELLTFEIRRVQIPLPRNVCDMTYTEFGELLTLVVNHPQLGKLLKVKGFFVNVGKAKMKLSKTISSSAVKRSSSTKATRESKKPAETLSNIVQLEDVKELERSYVDMNNPELITYLESLGYTEITPLANGASKAVFRAQNTKAEFVAVKVGKLEQSAKMREQKKITSSVGQKMSRALFGGFLQIHKIYTDIGNNLIVIEEELASKTLRDIIIEKRERGEIFTQDQLTKIIQDLVESLYHMHVQNQVVHRDIKPHNIFYTEHRYTFGDYGEAEQKNVNILDKKIKVRMHELKGTPMYMETKLLRLCNRTKLDAQLTTSAVLTETQVLRMKEAALDYDPFKADVYSLGLVFFELMLHNFGYTMDDQIETLFYWQRGEKLFDELLKSFDLRSKEEKYILLGGKLLVVPSLLERMLDENESERISTFELSLLSTHKSTILSNILTPFTDIFLPSCHVLEDGNFQVIYNYKLMIYEGDYRNGQRNGNGTMYRRNQSMISVILEQSSDLEEDSEDEKSKHTENERSATKQNLDNMHWQYQGVWRNDLPNRRGMLRLNDSDNRYSGEFVDGMFDGDGEVFFKDKLMYKAKWKSNYNDHILQPAESFKTGTYRFRDICREALTVYGFFEASEEPVRKFIIEIDSKMTAEIMNVLSELVRVLAKSAATAITLFRNPLYHYHEFSIETNEGRIVFIMLSLRELVTWFLQKVFAEFKLDALRSVNLELNDVESEPVETLSKRLECFNLIEINLAQCYFISEEALNKLLSSSMVNRVLKLILTATQSSDRTMKILAESSYLTKLREMNISCCRFITNAGLQAWLTSKNIKELELLDIGHTFLGKGMQAALKSESQLKKLRRLRLENVPLGFEDIRELCENNVVAGITELHCGAKWVPSLLLLEKLRTLHLCGTERVQRRMLFEFMTAWKHNKLEVTVSAQFQERETTLKFCRQSLRTHFEGSVWKLILPCTENGLRLVVDVVSDLIVRIDLEKKKEVEDFNEKLNEIRTKGGVIKQLTIRHTLSLKDCFERLLKCDFKEIRVERLTVANYCEEESMPTVRQSVEASKQKILQLSGIIKEALTIIKPKELNIPDIFLKESTIGQEFQQSTVDIEQLRINGSLSSTRKVFKKSHQPMQVCRATSNATLDETLHALAASESLGSLTELNLKGRSNVTDKGISYVINSKHCKKLVGLDLSNTCISSSVFLMLKGSDNMQLKSLCANNLPNSLNFEEVESYVMSENSRQLKRFQLKNCNLNQLDLFFLQLNLESLEEVDINFGGSLVSSIDYLDKLIAAAKYDRLKRIYLDLSKCKVNQYLPHILRVFSSKKVIKVKVNLAFLETTENFTDAMISEQIFVRNLSMTRRYDFYELNFNFSRTDIFKTNFFEFLSSQKVKHLRLTFAHRFDNADVVRLRDSLASTYLFLNTLELNISKCTEVNKEDASKALAELFSNLTNIDTLMLNFSLCRELQKWNVVLEGLQNLANVKTLHINLASCRITDETDILCEWITNKLMKNKRQVQLTLDLTSCWHIQSNDRCLVNIHKLIEDPSRFFGKIRVFMKGIRLQPVMKKKLVSLSKKPQYELQFEE